ncbi:hypothetical protein B7P43_G18400 [Cryptotermes secundus]|uniref:Uncharacterized protein n=1 Tax=Cryptotermes secundus TaxID=105785 RepID=A0A2J7PB64_9NEOP|nr:hypothetical protein B7P43_G18400 [Cryptotermes secundus]
MSFKWSGGATFDGAGGSGAKAPRYYNIVLESESEQPTDEDSESVHSIQGKETGLCVLVFCYKNLMVMNVC